MFDGILLFDDIFIYYENVLGLAMFGNLLATEI